MCYDTKITQSQNENTRIMIEQKTAKKIADEIKANIGEEIASQLQKSKLGQNIPIELPKTPKG